MRILVALEPRMYGEVFAHTLGERRPDHEVLRVLPEELDGELDHHDLGLVICDWVTERVQALAPAWIELLYSDNITATVCVGGREFSIEGVVIEDVLRVVDEVEQGCA